MVTRKHQAGVQINMLITDSGIKIVDIENRRGVGKQRIGTETEGLIEAINICSAPHKKPGA